MRRSKAGRTTWFKPAWVSSRGITIATFPDRSSSLRRRGELHRRGNALRPDVSTTGPAVCDLASVLLRRLRFVEPERRRIHAVALARRLRPVVEDVPQTGATPVANR